MLVLLNLLAFWQKILVPTNTTIPTAPSNNRKRALTTDKQVHLSQERARSQITGEVASGVVRELRRPESMEHGQEAGSAAKHSVKSA